MITYHQFHMIKHLQENNGLTASQIADELSLDRKTVTSWMVRECYEPRRSPRRGGQLDSFYEIIKARLAKHHTLTATQIFQNLKNEGYAGGYTVVKDYVRQVRVVKPEPFLTLHFDPGQCAQIDFGECGRIQIGNALRKYYVFVVTLCWSRMGYVEFTMKQTMEHFLQGIRNAFEYFGHVPSEIMVDNCKTAILEHPPVGEPLVNPRFKDMAKHYGFKVIACKPRRPNQKGRVEDGVKYVKMNFINGLDLSNFTALQAAGREWLDNIANVRTHATTRRKPVDMFEEEKTHLNPLPLMPYDCSVTKPITSNKMFRVSFDGNRYSVPSEYCSQKKLTLHILPDRLAVYRENKQIATHLRSYERNKDIEDPSHPMKALERKRNAKKQKLQKLFLSISPAAEIYYLGLKEKRLVPWNHLRNIMVLREIYGNDEVSKAIEEAVHFQAFSSEFIINYLRRKPIINVADDPIHLPRKRELLEIELEQPNMTVFDKTF